MVQALDQAIPLRLIDDKSQIEIVRSLADEVNALLGKQPECRPKLMEDTANVASDEAHRRAGANDFGATQICKLSLQTSEGLAIKGIRLRIERHGDVGFRGRDEVDRHAMPLEYLECIGQKTDLVPHARAFEGNQGYAFFDAHRLDLRRIVDGLRTDARAAHLRHLRRINK